MSPAKSIINEREFLELLDKGMKPSELSRHFGTSAASITKKLRKYRPNPIVQKYTRERNRDELNKQGKQYTEKKAKYVEARIEGKKPAQAAMIAYECKTPQSAAVMGHKMEQDHQVMKAMKDCLHDEGVTPTLRARKIRNILDEGAFSDQIKVLDHIAKLDGSYSPEKTLIGIASISKLILEVDEMVQG